MLYLLISAGSLKLSVPISFHLLVDKTLPAWLFQPIYIHYQCRVKSQGIGKKLYVKLPQLLCV